VGLGKCEEVGLGHGAKDARLEDSREEEEAMTIAGREDRKLLSSEASLQTQAEGAGDFKNLT
jgi:hypothetical protein